MSGSLGGGRSRSSQMSNAETFGYNQSQQESVSGSQSANISQSRQNIAFEDVFANLYGNASDAGARAAGGSGMVSSAAQQLFTGGSQFLQSLGGDAGSAYLNDRLSANNPVLNEQIAQLQQDTGRLFREEFNPAITSRAVSGGTLGGGRQGVAQGLAAESAARTFAQGATALRSNDIARRDTVAQSIAQNSLQASSTGLGALPSLLDVLQRGNNAELGAYSQLSQILGGPTVLSTSDAAGSSTSFAESLARAYGQQQSRSYGSGSGSSWNFDTSFGLIGS
jgi:hypothetical protein